MHRPKVGILKRVYLTNRGHYRYYSPYYDRAKIGKIPKKDRPKMPILDLNTINISTEKQLCSIIYSEFGEGEYRLVAYVKGRKGCWTFWKGLINKDGFIREKRISSYKKDVDRLKEKLVKAEDEIDRNSILEDIEIEKEFKDITYTKFGFTPFLKSNSRGGDLVLWNDVEVVENKEQWEDKKKEIEEWDIPKVKKEEFEVW